LIAAKKHELPKVKNAAWVRNDIDRFVLARLEHEGMAPSPEADRRTLIRRLSFDLVGLPPTPDEVDAFLADNGRDAYEKVVDRLLGSKHFGERMAVHWLDVVRYADTAGYHSDNHRDVYLYRDWVIDAFNNNMPFRDFAVAQIAGDMMPNPTNDQKIASGTIASCRRPRKAAARRRIHRQVCRGPRAQFLGGMAGLTLGCTECHDHKYDPFTTREFYKLASFFADIQEVPIGRQPQTPVMNSVQQEQVKKLDDEIAATQKKIAELPMDQAKDVQQKLAAVQKQKADFLKAIPSSLVSTAGPPRVMRILKRGDWLDDSGDVVLPDVPASLPGLKLDKQKTRATRLDLANWLVAPENR